jgi:hypothetical protein
MASDSKTKPAAPHATVTPGTGEITVDAAVLGTLLGLPAAEVPALMREGAITSLCERGEGEDEGRYRLSFFYRNRRARLHLDDAGCILRRGVIDFGETSLPARLRLAGG